MTTKPTTKNEGRASTSMMPAPDHSAAEAAENLEQTLEHFESMLEALENQVQESAKAGVTSEASATLEVADLKRMINEMFERLEGTLDRLTTQAERLSDGASDLAETSGRVESRMNEITRALREASSAQAAQPATSVAAAPASATPAEPQFQPGETPLGVVLAAVPGFQGLMDIQRALSGLPQTDGASVVAYKNGEASLEVVLNAPVAARQIVEGLRESTGEQLLIEESRPEAGKLRLRFVERDSGATA
ncbi:MAG: hypothetical protein J4N95_02240 [Chloroflexi bacterium]|nr:hypothetical protein [Chloroflexota bacterium]MCI0776974.1 hypothetical protein [Chloroflexota bacterium]MCI0890559.1 hypothetical protein [Chloroflexota bacterium]